jgi:hypothetical protein
MYAVVHEDRIEVMGVRLIKEYQIICVRDDYDSACRMLRNVVEWIVDGWWADTALFYSDNGNQKWTIKQVGVRS